jgi:hypothetical protein
MSDYDWKFIGNENRVCRSCNGIKQYVRSGIHRSPSSSWCALKNGKCYKVEDDFCPQFAHLSYNEQARKINELFRYR